MEASNIGHLLFSRPIANVATHVLMRCTPLKRNSFIAAAFALLVATWLPAVQAQPRRPAPMSPADILRVANVGEAQFSPNGQWVVYTVSTIEDSDTLSTLS